MNRVLLALLVAAGLWAPAFATPTSAPITPTPATAAPKPATAAPKPAPTAAAATTQARKAVQASYDRMAAAASRRDVNGWLAGKTDDFVSVGLDGSEVGLASRRALLTLLLTTVHSLKTDTRVTGVDLMAPDRALAKIHEHTEMTFTRLDKKKSKAVFDTVAEATWVKTPAGWRESRCRSLSEKGTLDGKLMPAPKP